MKKVFKIFGFILIVLTGGLYISDYSYLLDGVFKIYLTGHKTAFLSDYNYFDNRTLAASENPQAWPIHSEYNTISLSDDLEQHHKKTGTVAFLAIKNDSLYFVFTQDFIYNRPFYWDEKYAIESGDNEAYDPEKTITKENRYYFHNDRLFKWLDPEKRQIDLTSEENSILLSSKPSEAVVKNSARS